MVLVVGVQDQGLTASFPADAKDFEKDLHGGFNEDADTGIVYTGIPGYGCSYAPMHQTLLFPHLIVSLCAP